MKPLIKPNFFIVGAPKCGTSALYTYLKPHPEVFLSEPKEVNYFCKDFLKENKELYGKKHNYPGIQSEKDSGYLKLFQKAKDKKAIGEATVWYFHSKEAAKEIKKLNPNAKIIIMLREPVSFLYSLHSQMLMNCNEDIADFETALNCENERKKGSKIPKHIPWASRLFYSELIKFAECYKTYKDNFPKEQIKVIIFDDFKNDTEKVYKEILAFLKIDNQFKTNFKIVNPNQVNKGKIANILRNPQLKSIARKLFPQSLINYLNNLVSKITTKVEKRKPLDEKLRKKLMKNFKPEVEKLSKALKRDFVKLWGYNDV